MMRDTREGGPKDMPGPTNQQSPEEQDSRGSSGSGLAGALQPEVASILDQALSGGDISAEEATTLFECSGAEYNALVWTADELRRRTVGDVVTYVVNRNINFTNVCIKRCGFCAFSRDFREEEGYFLPVSEIVRRAKEAWDLRRNRGLHPGRSSTADGRRHLHSSLRSHQVGVARHTHPRVLSRRGALRIGPVTVHHQGIPGRPEGRRRRQPAGHFRGNIGTRNSGTRSPRAGSTSSSGSR